jgi:glycosyltransferase involved in cell wall biosynthesis
MRIGVDIRCLMDGGRTGVEEYTTNVLHAMLAQDSSDAFVLFANSRKPMTLPQFAAPNVELKTFAYPNKIFNTSLKLLKWPKLDEMLGGVDVLFVPSVRLAPCTIKTPLVATFHDLSFVRHANYFSAKRRLWHMLMEPKRMARKATKLIAVSQTTATDLEELYKIDKEKIQVIHSGISNNIKRINTDSEIARQVKEKYGLPESYILFLGTIEPRKNLDGLLLSYAAARRAGITQKLVIAGVRGWVGNSFYARAKNHPFAKDIIFTGYVTDEDKPALYSLADLFVYPSFYEGFGFPPLEAILCGVPVITSYNSAIPEIVGQWATLVNPYDPDELGWAIVQKLRNTMPIFDTTISEIREKYNWTRAGAETLGALKSSAMINK